MERKKALIKKPLLNRSEPAKDRQRMLAGVARYPRQVQQSLPSMGPAIRSYFSGGTHSALRLCSGVGSVFSQVAFAYFLHLMKRSGSVLPTATGQEIQLAQLRAELRILYRQLSEPDGTKTPDLPNQLLLLEKVLQCMRPFTRLAESYRSGVICYQSLRSRDPGALSRCREWARSVALHL